MLLLAAHGSLPLREVMKYAIGYARDGYPVRARGQRRASASVAGVFTEHWPSSAEIYLAGGVPAPGSRFANPVLAGTYQRILAEAEAAGSDREAQIEAARRAFYEGFVAEAIGGYLARAEVMDGTGEPHAGLLTAADLAAWRASAEPPVTAGYAGPDRVQDRPVGTGPGVPAAVAAAGRVRPRRHGAGRRGPHPHRRGVREAGVRRPGGLVRRPGFTEVPLADLLSPQYAAQRRALVGPVRLAATCARAAPAGGSPRLPRLSSPPPRRGTAAGAWAGEPTLAHSGDTCHLDVADRFGNVVAATPSGGWLHSSPVIPGLGFCLGTRAQMFTLTPGLPNSLAPGKRPRTTLSPGLALRGGEPYLAFGTPGGDQQDQWALSFFLNHVQFGMNLQEAIDAPAFHTRHFPSSFWPRESFPAAVDVEDRAGRRVIEGLRARGHEVTVSAALVPRPGQRRRPGRRPALRGRQRARDAGLRGGR